jgi:hypothetical protein
MGAKNVGRRSAKILVEDHMSIMHVNGENWWMFLPPLLLLSLPSSLSIFKITSSSESDHGENSWRTSDVDEFIPPSFISLISLKNDLSAKLAPRLLMTQILRIRTFIFQFRTTPPHISVEFFAGGWIIQGNRKRKENGGKLSEKWKGGISREFIKVFGQGAEWFGGALRWLIDL